MRWLMELAAAHPWAAVVAALALLLAAGFTFRKSKVLAIILAVAGIIVSCVVILSGALKGIKPGDINKLKDTTKRKVVESIHRELHR